MADLRPIQIVVNRARRRLRLQGAAEVACAVIPLGAGLALTAALAQLPALYGAAGALVTAGAIAGAAWPRRDEAIAARLDHVSGLADRLTTALALDGKAAEDPVTRDLQRLAVADGVRAAGRANVRAAAPFTTPRHLRAAVASIALVAIVGALDLFPTSEHGALSLRPMALRDPAMRTAALVEAEPALAPEDVAYLETLLDEVRAGSPDDETVQTWADEVEAKLAAAAAGQLTRADLLAALDQLASPGDLGPLDDDMIEGVRQARPPGDPPPPPEPPPPPLPPPPPNPVCENPDGDGHGEQPGAHHDDDLAGDPTKKQGDTEDVRLDSTQGEGPSRRDTVVAAAKHGFSSAAYKDVYADYKAIVEQVLHGEHVPSSYRYVVKRYFQRIHPS